MPVVDLAILGLSGTILLFSLIELGLSAWAVSLTDGTYYGYRVTAPSQFAFLLFASLWTLLVFGALTILNFLMGGRQGGVTHRFSWLGFVTLGVNFVTCVFWLAGFAALADYYNGGVATGNFAALLAFAVLLWSVPLRPALQYIADTSAGFSSQHSLSLTSSAPSLSCAAIVAATGHYSLATEKSPAPPMADRS
jgi:hypothetical protein